MRKTLCLLALLPVLLGLTALSAQAQNIHFVEEPSCSGDRVCGKLAGLGNKDVLITLNYEATLTAVCANKGGNEAPGQNKVTRRGTITKKISRNEVKNGSVSFCLDLPSEEDFSVSAREAGCPNNNWDARVTDVDITSTLTVEHDGRTLTRTIDCD